MLTNVSIIQFLCRIYDPPEYGFIDFGAHGDPIISSCEAPNFCSTSFFSVHTLSMHPDNVIKPTIVINAIQVPMALIFLIFILFSIFSPVCLLIPASRVVLSLT
jgi:hypothetical protein